ncbi:MAG: hypothetical protein J6S29_02765 [Methanosphaera sp.]|nr:hypothetical protein [Methanosphaera sp.]
MMKSIKLNENGKNRFIERTGHLVHESPHQYEKVRINDDGIILILYNSGSLVYENNDKTRNFINANLKDVFSDKSSKARSGNRSNYKKSKGYSRQNSPNHKKRYYKKSGKQKSKNNEDSFNNSNILLSKYEYTIGSDETGKGEWFGPLVVCAAATSNSENIRLKEIGVNDSKKLNKKQINEVYEKIMEMNIKHEVIALRPFSYNKLYKKFRDEGKNLNHMLAYLHSKVIRMLLERLDCEDTLIIIDKFDAKKMNEYLNDQSNMIQIKNGERFIPVATSSIIAKYHYEKVLNELEERYNIRLNKKTKIKNIDKKILDKVAKTHFKNIAKHLY